MPRLAVLFTGCSVFLVASWAMVAIHQANQDLVPRPSQQEPPSVARTDGAKVDAVVLQAPLKQSPGPDVRREELERARKPAPLAKKKREGARGIAVDRKNIVETVEMEDLRAPPGRLWIPAALSGPINHKGGDPLFTVLVAYCQLDMDAYHEGPWLFAMGAFHQRVSGCLDDPSLTRTYRLSSLKVRPVGWWVYKVTPKYKVWQVAHERSVCEKVVQGDCTVNMVTFLNITSYLPKNTPLAAAAACVYTLSSH